ncbi:zona pellucida sperm-binding protein 3-like isoform X3 [Sparus aurata]|uniref:zona pellucida sperm-binding protein 3-like isoform X3 n=1 Tax=Sparus aurata TaxID=8175 RepID=UPI0011C13B06|nr:zona pellucida sperm-binding protein 3-like isoform X3 [Sparus aurata]
MPLISAYFTLSLYILSKLDTIGCYSYQTKPLFLSFSELAALERTSLDRTERPDAHVGDPTVKTFVVKCHEDSIEVVMKAYLFDPSWHVEPKDLRLGPVGAAEHHCVARGSGNREYIIRARLTDCGGKVTVGDTLREKGAAVPVQCEYGRRYTVSSGALKPTWIPLISTLSTHLDLDFHLRLMTGDWSSERKSSVFFLSDAVNIQASVDHHHPPLRLFADSCVATLTPDAYSYPRYPFIDHRGCFTDSQLHGSSSRFLPRVEDHLLHIQLQPFLFHQDHRHTIYITCYLAAEPISNKDPGKRACYVTSGRWRSVDGDDRVCESCSSSAKSNHKRAARSRTKHRPAEPHKETSLGPIIFLRPHRKHKHLDRSN